MWTGLVLLILATTAPVTAPTTAPSTQQVQEERDQKRREYLRIRLVAAEEALKRVEQIVDQADREALQLPKLDRAATAAFNQGRLAEGELRAILIRLNLESLAANEAGHTIFEGEGRLVDRYGVTTDVGVRFQGEARDIGKRLAAINAVGDKYGPELQRARQKVSDAYVRYQELDRQYMAIYRRQGQARFAYDAATKKALDAHGAMDRFLTTRAASQPATAPTPSRKPDIFDELAAEPTSRPSKPD